MDKFLTTNTKYTLIREAARRHLTSYCLVIDPAYELNWHHKLIANELEKALEKVLKGEKVRLILELPPRHGKSDLASVKFPSWVLGKHPELKFIITSYAAELAETFGGKTKDLVNDEDYQKIFSTKLKTDTKAKNRWNTDKKGGYVAAGVGGAITGKGFNIGIIDDPFKNKEEAESELMREKIWEWYKTVFYTRQEGYSAIIVIMQRWHEDDLTGKLILQEEESKAANIPEANYDHWTIIKFPAIAEEDEQFRKKGEALWPSKYPLDFLKTQQNTMSPYEFSALYQQEPLPTENAEFNQSWFIYFEQENIKNKNFEIDITIDPAIGKKKENCHSSITAVAKDIVEPDWYILDYEFGKWDPYELMSATFTLYERIFKDYSRYNIRVWVETIAYQKALMYLFKEEMRKRKIFFNLNEFHDSGDKETRIRGLIPLYKTGVIHHRKWMKELEKELLSFPKGKYIDIADSLSFNLRFKKPTRTQELYKQKPYIPTSAYEGGE